MVFSITCFFYNGMRRPSLAERVAASRMRTTIRLFGREGEVIARVGLAAKDIGEVGDIVAIGGGVYGDAVVGFLCPFEQVLII